MTFPALVRFAAVEILHINVLSALANVSHEAGLGLLGRTHKFFGSAATRSAEGHRKLAFSVTRKKLPKMVPILPKMALSLSFQSHLNNSHLNNLPAFSKHNGIKNRCEKNFP